MRIQIRGKTDVGRTRDHNEDCYGMFPTPLDGEVPSDNVIILADGMGGLAGGEIASKLVVDTIVGYYAGASDGRVDRAEERLEKALQEANNRVLEEVKSRPDREGMGATAVAAHVEDGALYVGHAGDCRCYRIRHESIERLTRDHSMVQELVDAGKITEEEMITHPRKNVVMRALGIEPDLEFELSAFVLESGDTFLLCSDGLSGVLKDEIILDVFQRHENADDLDVICSDLIALANELDGSDNISAVVFRIL